MDPLTAAGKKTKRQEAGGIEEGGQKKAIAREEGRKIEKRRRSGGRSRRRKRSQVGWKWRGGIKGARGVRELDSMEKNITWLILQAPPITLGPGSPARPVFRRDLTKYVADSFVGSAG